ncbi:MAG: tRNA pseudouridine(55) synthase TruB [Chloroflexi bacterium]|nr:tRNA pseudouridine(55) synthase TruB [Chloroflexota bacterium]
MSGPFFDGILNIDKPLDMTSMDVIRRIKRLSAQKHVGHGGTLDPQATGVFPVLFGQATRIMEYLVASAKTYRAVVKLGVTTDTYDSAGKVVRTGDASGITRHEIERALAAFRGNIYQVPPMFSALKREGKRLYDLARMGIEVPRQPRKVEVLRIDLTEWSQPDMVLEIECGRGVYIRALAHDLGEALACGAYLKALTRLKTGPFSIREAIPLPQLEDSLKEGSWRELLYPIDYPLLHMKAVAVDSRIEHLILSGRPLPLTLRIPHSEAYQECRAYSSDGRFLGTVRFDPLRDQWLPHKMFASPSVEEEV